MSVNLENMGICNLFMGKYQSVVEKPRYLAQWDKGKKKKKTWNSSIGRVK